MRNKFSSTLYEIGTADPKIFCVVADISPAGSMEDFRQEFPDRFINVGVAEQAMIGISAGLALRGCKPFAYTIAPFTIYRPFEMVRDDLCYQNLPVTVVGMGSGITYSVLGGTHHTMEDVAVMGAIPNMTILAPCDPLEVVEATKIAANAPGPVYLRIGKAGEPNLTENAPEPFEFGKPRHIRGTGKDLAILCYGPIMSMAFEVADRLEKTGRQTSIYSMHTLKPLDRIRIGEILNSYETVMVLEEHTERGGLAAQVKETAWDSKANCRLETFSLKDEFIHLYGSHDDLRKAHGLHPDIIFDKITSQ